MRLPDCVPSDTPHDRHLRRDECECGADGVWEYGSFFCTSDRHDERMRELERLCDDERTCPQCFDYVENCACGRKGDE